MENVPTRLQALPRNFQRNARTRTPSGLKLGLNQSFIADFRSDGLKHRVIPKEWALRSLGQGIHQSLKRPHHKTELGIKHHVTEKV